MAKRGRKSSLTKEVQELICKCIRAGNNLGASAQSAGITPQAMNNWLREGQKKKDGKYFYFFQAVKKAEADAQVHAVAIIRNAMGKSWQAAAWWLERKVPQEWAKREYVEQVNKDEKLDAIEKKAKEDPATAKLLLELLRRVQCNEGNSSVVRVEGE